MSKNNQMKNQEQPAADKRVLRSYEHQEFRAQEVDGVKTLVGHPAVFNRKADIGGWFDEIIEPGAFNGCDMTDVLLFVNHKQNKVPLARSRRNNGKSTMTLTVDEIGLHMEAKIDTENNQEARTVYSAVERGDIDGMSFCFRVAEEEWLDLETKHPTRKIKRIDKVYEVSAVNEPAYSQTDILARDQAALDSARQALDNAKRSAGVDTSNELEVYKLKNEILAKR